MVGPSPGGASPGPGAMTTITMLWSIPLTQLLLGASEAQAFSKQLQDALAAFFSVPVTQVQVQLQLQASATQQRHLLQVPQPAGHTWQACVTVLALWPTADTTIPSWLQQQLGILQRTPAAPLTPELVSRYGIDMAHVALQQVSVTPPLPASAALPASPSPAAAPAPAPGGADTSSSSGSRPAGSSSNDTVLSRAAMIGIIVGGAALVALSAAALLAALLVWRRKRRSYSLARTHSEPMSKGGASGVLVSSGALASSVLTSTSSTIKSSQLHLRIESVEQGDVFLVATARQYGWTKALPPEPVAVEAGINDAQLDNQPPDMAQQQAAPGCSSCPVVQLTKREVLQQIVLVTDGLIAQGPSWLMFKCTWPTRFGPNAMLAIKVLRDGYDCDAQAWLAMAYDAAVLSSARHPNVVKLYGYCLERPTLCLITELLPHSLAQLMSSQPPVLPRAAPPASQDSSCGWMAAAVRTASARSNSHSRPASGRIYPASNTLQDMGRSSLPPRSGSLGSTTDLPVAEAEVTLPGAKPVDGTQPSEMSGLQDVVRIASDLAAGLAYLHGLDAPAVQLPASEQGEADKDGAGAMLAPSSQPPSCSTRHSKVVLRGLHPGGVLLNSQRVAKISSMGGDLRHITTSTLVTLPCLAYLAPELLLAAHCAGVPGEVQPATDRADIYSVGMLVWALLSGEAPWKVLPPAAVMALVMNGKRPALPLDPAAADTTTSSLSGRPLLAEQAPALAHQLCSIISACWQQNDASRPSATALQARLAVFL